MNLDSAEGEEKLMAYQWHQSFQRNVDPNSRTAQLEKTAFFQLHCVTGKQH